MRPVGELDQAGAEDAGDGQVERRDACPRRAPREGLGEPVGGEDSVFGGEQMPGDGERELVAGEPVAADERERHSARCDQRGRCERDRCSWSMRWRRR